MKRIFILQGIMLLLISTFAFADSPSPGPGDVVIYNNTDNPLQFQITWPGGLKSTSPACIPSRWHVVFYQSVFSKVPSNAQLTFNIAACSQVSRWTALTPDPIASYNVNNSYNYSCTETQCTQGTPESMRRSMRKMVSIK